VSVSLVVGVGIVVVVIGVGVAVVFVDGVERAAFIRSLLPGVYHRPSSTSSGSVPTTDPAIRVVAAGPAHIFASARAVSRCYILFVLALYKMKVVQLNLSALDLVSFVTCYSILSRIWKEWI